MLFLSCIWAVCCVNAYKFINYRPNSYSISLEKTGCKYCIIFDFSTGKDKDICREMSGMTGKEEKMKNYAEDDTFNSNKICYIMYLTTNIHGRTGKGKEPIELGLSIRRREKIL